MGKKDYKSKDISLPFAVCAGTGVGVLVMVIGVFLITLLIHNETIESNSIGYFVLADTFISAMLGCITSIIIAKRKMLIISLLTSIAIMVVFVSITALFFGGQFSGVPVTFVVIIGAGISAALILYKVIGRPKTYHRKVKL